MDTYMIFVSKKFLEMEAQFYLDLIKSYADCRA